MSATQKIQNIAESICESLEIELIDVEMDRGVLRVIVDREGGLPVGALTSLTRQINRILDEDDPIPGEYTLEISSPGLERNLRKPAHFIRAIGEKVSVRIGGGPNSGPRRVQGEILAADDDGFILALEHPTPTDPPDGLRLGYSEIDKARTVFEWSASPKVAGPKKSAKKAAEP